MIDAVVPALRSLDAVEAVWEGGSAATGRLDAFSDIDLCIVAAADRTDQVFDAVERALAAVAPIEHTWRVEPPAFRDMAQRFYLLADAPPYFAVDCSVLAPAGVEQFLERERHGEPLAYFDRAGRTVPRTRRSAATGSRRSGRRRRSTRCSRARSWRAAARSRRWGFTRRCCVRWSNCSA